VRSMKKSGKTGNGKRFQCASAAYGRVTGKRENKSRLTATFNISYEYGISCLLDFVFFLLLDEKKKRNHQKGGKLKGKNGISESIKEGGTRQEKDRMKGGGIQSVVPIRARSGNGKTKRQLEKSKNSAKGKDKGRVQGITP